MLQSPRHPLSASGLSAGFSAYSGLSAGSPGSRRVHSRLSTDSSPRTPRRGQGPAPQRLGAEDPAELSQSADELRADVAQARKQYETESTLARRSVAASVVDACVFLVSQPCANGRRRGRCCCGCGVGLCCTKCPRRLWQPGAAPLPTTRLSLAEVLGSVDAVPLREEDVQRLEQLELQHQIELRQMRETFEAHNERRRQRTEAVRQRLQREAAAFAVAAADTDHGLRQEAEDAKLQHHLREAERLRILTKIDTEAIQVYKGRSAKHQLALETAEKRHEELRQRLADEQKATEEELRRVANAMSDEDAELLAEVEASRKHRADADAALCRHWSSAGLRRPQLVAERNLAAARQAQTNWEAGRQAAAAAEKAAAERVRREAQQAEEAANAAEAARDAAASTLAVRKVRRAQELDALSEECERQRDELAAYQDRLNTAADTADHVEALYVDATDRLAALRDLAALVRPENAAVAAAVASTAGIVSLAAVHGSAAVQSAVCVCAVAACVVHCSLYGPMHRSVVASFRKLKRGSGLPTDTALGPFTPDSPRSIPVDGAISGPQYHAFLDWVSTRDCLSPRAAGLAPRFARMRRVQVAGFCMSTPPPSVDGPALSPELQQLVLGEAPQKRKRPQPLRLNAVEEKAVAALALAAEGRKHAALLRILPHRAIGRAARMLRARGSPNHRRASKRRKDAPAEPPAVPPPCVDDDGASDDRLSEEAIVDPRLLTERLSGSGPCWRPVVVKASPTRTRAKRLLEKQTRRCAPDPPGSFRTGRSRDVVLCTPTTPAARSTWFGTPPVSPAAQPLGGWFTSPKKPRPARGGWFSSPPEPVPPEPAPPQPVGLSPGTDALPERGPAPAKTPLRPMTPPEPATAPPPPTSPPAAPRWGQRVRAPTKGVKGSAPKQLRVLMRGVHATRVPRRGRRRSPPPRARTAGAKKKSPVLRVAVARRQPDVVPTASLQPPTTD